MDKRGITPNVFSYSAAISACEKGSQWENALELLREMDKCGITPNVVSYNATISAFEKGGQWEKALKLL
jgi:pentatricopeptide repeat domain-containing protein 1